MKEKTDWQQALAWWDGVAYLVVFDPRHTYSAAPLVSPSPDSFHDDEELKLLEMADRLVMLKGRKKH